FLISERLAQYVGYDLPQVAQSLDTLITAGLLQRSPNATHPAQLYVLARGSPLGGWVSSLLRVAEQREGRLAVIQALKQRPPLGVEFVYRGARQFDEPGVIVLFEVASDKLIRDAALFGWDLGELERDGRLKLIFTTRQLFHQELQQADSPLLAEAAEIGARRI